MAEMDAASHPVRAVLRTVLGGTWHLIYELNPAYSTKGAVHTLMLFELASSRAPLVRKTTAIVAL